MAGMVYSVGTAAISHCVHWLWLKAVFEIDIIFWNSQFIRETATVARRKKNQIRRQESRMKKKKEPSHQSLIKCCYSAQTIATE